MVPVQVTRMRKAAKIKMQKVILRYAHICADVFFFVITLLNKMNDFNLWGVAVVLLLLRRIEF